MCRAGWSRSRTTDLLYLVLVGWTRDCICDGSSRHGCGVWFSFWWTESTTGHRERRQEGQSTSRSTNVVARHAEQIVIISARDFSLSCWWGSSVTTYAQHHVRSKQQSNQEHHITPHLWAVSKFDRVTCLIELTRLGLPRNVPHMRHALGLAAQPHTKCNLGTILTRPRLFAACDYVPCFRYHHSSEYRLIKSPSALALIFTFKQLNCSSTVRLYGTSLKRRESWRQRQLQWRRDWDWRHTSMADTM